MTRYYFGKEAAEALIGQRVRSLVEFRGVPKGTVSKVVRAYPNVMAIATAWGSSQEPVPLLGETTGGQVLAG